MFILSEVYFSPFSDIADLADFGKEGTRCLRHRLSVWESYGEVEQQGNFEVHIKLMKHRSDSSEIKE